MDKETRSVLPVDGSTTMLYYHGILLQRLEYTVQTAASAESAMEAVERAAPSVVLTEITLPLMSGIDLIKRLKASDRTKNVPVVVLTGEQDEKLKAACPSMGCAGYLFKPVATGLLFRTLQAASEPLPREHIRLATRLKVIVGDGSPLEGSERTGYATALSEGGSTCARSTRSPGAHSRRSGSSSRTARSRPKRSFFTIIRYKGGPSHGARHGHEVRGDIGRGPRVREGLYRGAAHEGHRQRACLLTGTMR